MKGPLMSNVFLFCLNRQTTNPHGRPSFDRTILFRNTEESLSSIHHSVSNFTLWLVLVYVLDLHTSWTSVLVQGGS